MKETNALQTRRGWSVKHCYWAIQKLQLSCVSWMGVWQMPSSWPWQVVVISWLRRSIVTFR